MYMYRPHDHMNLLVSSPYQIDFILSDSQCHYATVSIQYVVFIESRNSWMWTWRVKGL